MVEKYPDNLILMKLLSPISELPLTAVGDFPISYRNLLEGTTPRWKALQVEDSGGGLRSHKVVTTRRKSWSYIHPATPTADHRKGFASTRASFEEANPAVFPFTMAPTPTTTTTPTWLHKVHLLREDSNNDAKSLSISGTDLTFVVPFMIVLAVVGMVCT